MEDAQLLREFVQRNAQDAFAEVVRRYVDLVHSVALRHTTSHALSQEITQTVFLILARQAGRVASHPCLAGWLHRTASQVASRALRTEWRRQRRESEAAALTSPNMKDPDDSQSILNCLDEAMSQLGRSDHSVLVLRYFLRKSMKDVGAALGTTEPAAKMRVQRALGRLRNELARKGILCSSTLLAEVLEQSAVISAPSAIVPAITQQIATTVVPSVSNLTLAGTYLLMSSLQTKVIVGTVLLAALLAGSIWRASDLGADATADLGDSTAGHAFTVSEGRASGVSTRGPERPSRKATTEAELAATRRELIDALSGPLPKSGISWPDPRVLAALERFGDRRDLAFAAIRDFIRARPSGLEEGDSLKAQARDLARGRALLALGTLDRDLPGLRTFLWELARSGDATDESMSFVALRKLGFEATDLPDLVERLQNANTRYPTLNRGLPESIRSLAQTDAGSFAPHATKLLDRLDDPDSAMRLRAASALFGLPQGGDPRVVAQIRTALQGGELEALIAIEAAAAGGDPARTLIPDLKQYAETAERRHMKDLALKAIAAIAPDAIASIPEVAAERARSAESESIRSRVNSATRTFDDLVAGLREPSVAVTAATALAEWGPAAASALPNLRSALAGSDEESRDRIVEAMRRIDPAIQVERIPFDTVFSGIVHGTSAVPEETTDRTLRQADLWLEDYRMHSTWRTPEELASLIQKLAPNAPSIADAFLRGIAEKDPALAARLRTSAR